MHKNTKLYITKHNISTVIFVYISPDGVQQKGKHDNNKCCCYVCNPTFTLSAVNLDIYIFNILTLMLLERCVMLKMIIYLLDITLMLSVPSDERYNIFVLLYHLKNKSQLKCLIKMLTSFNRNHHGIYYYYYFDLS